MPRRLSALPGSRLRQGPRRMEPDGALLQLHARAQHSRLRGLCGRHRKGHCPSPIRSCNRPAVDMARSGGILAPYRATARNCPPHAYRSSLREYLLSLVGQIDFDFDRRCARRSLLAHENHMRGKTNFGSRVKPIPPVQSCHGKYSAFVFSEIDVPCSHPALDQEGRFAIVTNVERGMRWTCQSCSALLAGRRTTLMRTAKPCGPGIPTLMPSFATTLSRRAGDGGQKARCTGESAV